MRSVNVIVLHACITLASATELADRNGIEQNLIDRLNMALYKSNLDATTFAKPAASTNVRPIGTMNRAMMPMTRFGGGPANLRAGGRVAAGIQEGQVAGRYAEGLFKLAEEKNELEAVKASTDAIKLVLTQVPELEKTLGDPMVPVGTKRELLDKMLDKKSTAHNFCNLLIDKQRVELLPAILQNFEDLYNSKSDIEECIVTSACKLTEDQLFNIAKTVRTQTGAKSVKIREQIDDNLIGGFILTFAGQQVDLSIRSGLEAIRQQLKSASLLPS